MKRHHPNTNNRFLDGEQLLKKAMRQKFRVRTDNKLKGAYAETDLDKRTIRINKKKHRSGYKGKLRHYQRNKNGTESLLNTIVHELEHVASPRATEKQVAKRARTTLTHRLSTHTKKKLYRLVKK